MGLFSKKNKALREIKYTIQEVRKDLVKCRKAIYDSRESEGHRDFVSFVEKLRNLEILQLAHIKDVTTESHAYHRGRIEALTNILNVRETYIEDMKTTLAKDKKSKTENKLARSYIKKPSQAGLSI